MKEVVVLSGKGGTGKTSVVGAFAALAREKVLSDCDVDAADLHLLLSPVPVEEHEFWSGQVAVIDPVKCTRCGLCEEACRFDAIHDCTVGRTGCEGCGLCARICPVGAITMRENMAGHWFISDTRFGPLVHAKLGIAQENSGKLVYLVRQKAKETAIQHGLDVTINDGPPGIGCAVISSLSGASLACIVTEPSVSGIHDLERVTQVCSHFGVPALVCVNKYDINEEGTRQVESYCADHGIELIAKIPFDTRVTEAQVQGVSIVEYTDDARLVGPIEGAWKSVAARMSVA
ncbi:MAG: ATP-binding protein [Dehalococcoidia bacterium]|nr:ATP-binding protein [Dehalococcoidia bacterium]